MEMNIVAGRGIGDVRLGMTVEAAEGLLGPADEVETIDSATEGSALVWRYGELGLTLFFEGEAPLLNCIDATPADCTLFGKPIVALKEAGLVRLMKAEGYADCEVEEEDWGERCVSYPNAGLDFYFDEGGLASVTVGR